MVRKEKRAALMTWATFASFIVFYLPITTQYFVNIAYQVKSPTAMHLGIWLYFCNSLCNPIMYLVSNPDLRRAF
jgi:hypothetical protein